MAKPEYVKAGYWLSESSSSFPAININTNLFTHIFCAFADIDPTTDYQVTISSSKQPQISSFSGTIKQKNPDVKTLLSIGGDGANSKSFALMTSRSSTRQSFIDSSINLARLYKFDGLDIQWLYPFKDIQMANLGTLLEEWRDALERESKEQQLPRLLLVATVFYSPFVNSLAYPVEAMILSLDWINVMAYDFYTPDSSTNETGPAAAFFNSKTKSLSGSFGIQQWVQDKNFPPDNIVLGLPFYGWAWLLKDVTKHRPFSPAGGPATDISSNGLVDYGNIMTLISSESTAKTVFDEKDIFNYAYYDTNWISYDDVKSISAKISKAKAMNLLGYFAWNIGGDDVYGTLSITASKQWGA